MKEKKEMYMWHAITYKQKYGKTGSKPSNQK